MEFKHLIYVPFTGLGLYGGFRGNRWLRNRIKIFEQFVIPSLKAQTNQNFSLWISWRPEEKRNPIVREFIKQNWGIETIHTFHGLCFWDDKFSDDIAQNQLLTNLHGTMGELVDHIGDVDYVFMTIHPSDDCYNKNAVKGIQTCFKEIPTLEAFGFDRVLDLSKSNNLYLKLVVMEKQDYVLNIFEFVLFSQMQKRSAYNSW